MKLFTPDKNDKNKVFRNVMLTVLFFYMFITTLIVIAMFLDKNFDQFESYFLSISTVLIAAMTNYFYFVSSKEKVEMKINSDKEKLIL